MKDYSETHQKGCLLQESKLPIMIEDCDFGFQVATDGRVWICVDGKAFLRFRPEKRSKPEDDLAKSLEFLPQLDYDELVLLMKVLEKELDKRTMEIDDE